MNIQFFLELLSKPMFIIFISTFAGSFIGELYKEVNSNTKNKKQNSFFKILSRFLASWLVSAALMLLFKSFFGINKNEILTALSLIFGFMGHKETLKYAKNLINSKFNTK